MTLKVAVIGVGEMGRNHARVYSDMDRVELVGIADRNEPVRKRCARIYHVPDYADYQKMLKQEKPDIVSVVVPTTLHCEIACETMAHGAHVLVEKPLAFSIDEGRKMISIAESYNVKLTVGHIERFNPAIVEVKKRMQNKELGKIFQIHARRHSPFPNRINDVGVVLDLASHDIDVMRYLLESEVVRAFAEIEHVIQIGGEDILSGLLRFQSGVIGVLDVNWVTPSKVRQLTVLGERGMYFIDYLTQDVFWHKNGEIVDWAALEVLRGVQEGDIIKLHFPKKEPLRAELEAFVATILEGRKLEVTGDDGLMVVNLANKLLESANSHMPICILKENN